MGIPVQSVNQLSASSPARTFLSSLSLNKVLHITIISPVCVFLSSLSLSASHYQQECSCRVSQKIIWCQTSSACAACKQKKGGGEITSKCPQHACCNLSCNCYTLERSLSEICTTILSDRSIQHTKSMCLALTYLICTPEYRWLKMSLSSNFP